MIDQEMLTTISRIYDAAVAPDSWEESLARVARHTGASLSMIMAVDCANSEANVNRASRILSAEAIGSYNSGVNNEEPQYWEMLRSFKAQRIFSDIDLVPDRSIYNTIPMVKWGLKYANVYNRAIIRLNDHKAWTDGLVLMYGADRGPINDNERNIISLFVPHVAKVIELNRPFRILERRFNAVLAALDRFHVGVCILSRTGDLIVSNRAARRVLDAKDGLRVDMRGKLRCIDAKTDNELAQAVENICTPSGIRGLNSEYKTVASRSAGRDQLLIEISPLTDPNDEIGNDLLGAVVFIIDPEDKAIVSTQGLQSLYGLTGAEAEVGRLIVEGHGTGDIADIRNVSMETIRGQVKALFGKTGVSKRSELFPSICQSTENEWRNCPFPM